MVERGPEKAGVGGSIPSLGILYFQRVKAFTLYDKGTLFTIC